MGEFNFVLKNEFWTKETQDTLFHGEPVRELSPIAMMADLLVEIGAFESKGQAKKNWKKEPNIPLGFTDFIGIGKHRLRITTWKPVGTK